MPTGNQQARAGGILASAVGTAFDAAAMFRRGLQLVTESTHEQNEYVRVRAGLGEALPSPARTPSRIKVVRTLVRVASPGEALKAIRRARAPRCPHCGALPDLPAGNPKVSD